MPRTPNSTFKSEKNLEESGSGIYLFRIEYTSGSYIYLCNYDTNVIYDGHTYTAFPIKHNYISEQSEGRIDAIEITMGNVSRYIQAYLESYNGLRGTEVVI